MKGTEDKDTDQRISLLSEKNKGGTDEKEDEGLEIHKPVLVEKRRDLWENFVRWRKDPRIYGGKESEALMGSVLDDDEGVVGGGDISTSDLVYESKAEIEGITNNSDIYDDARDKEDITDENDEEKKEDDPLFTRVPSKEHSESLKSSSSPTSVMVSSDNKPPSGEDSSESSSEGDSGDSYESISEDGSVVGKYEHVDLLLHPLEYTTCNSDDNSDDSSIDEESDDYVLKNISDTCRPTLSRRCASSKSYFNKGECSSNFSQSPLSRNLSLRSGFSDNDEQEDNHCIDPDGRKLIHGRIKGLGSSISPQKRSSPRTFWERLQTFRNGTVGMEKMNVGTSSWTNNVENTMTEIVDAVLFPEPIFEGYMIAPDKDFDTKPTSRNVNQRESEPMSSKLDYRDNSNYIKCIERKLRQNDLEITCWKNRVRELEEEVSRLIGVINENSLLNNTCSEGSTAIEWQT